MKRIEFQKGLTVQKIEKELLPEVQESLKQLSALQVDLDFPESCGDVAVYINYHKRLDEAVGALNDAVESLAVYEQLRENFNERENEKLPDEGIRTGYRVGQ